jgi:opacity protein-like surface antigen
MKKILALCAGVAMLGSVAAQAADVQMDIVTAGQTQTNNSTINQTANATGGNGGIAAVVGAGNANARGGDAVAVNRARVRQNNQICTAVGIC